MKKSTALAAVLFMLLPNLLNPPTARADAGMGLYPDGPLLEIGDRPGFRPYPYRSYGYPRYTPYYNYPGYKQYYGYPRPPQRYDQYRYIPRHKRPPYYYERDYYERYYDYPRRPPYRSFERRTPGWGEDPRFERRYR